MAFTALIVFITFSLHYPQVYAPPKAVVILRSAASDVHPCVQWTPLAELLFQSTDLAAVYVFVVSDLIGELVC